MFRGPAGLGESSTEVKPAAAMPAISFHQGVGVMGVRQAARRWGMVSVSVFPSWRFDVFK